mmetsp:Transcript_48667/g.105971  ORF Transcript_48667/g.105971 Transcript_48667/m.105971 type:complete len:273 (-) Transcript_48667:392-1210(-)
MTFHAELCPSAKNVALVAVVEITLLTAKAIHPFGLVKICNSTKAASICPTITAPSIVLCGAKWFQLVPVFADAFLACVLQFFDLLQDFLLSRAKLGPVLEILNAFNSHDLQTVRDLCTFAISCVDFLVGGVKQFLNCLQVAPFELNLGEFVHGVFFVWVQPFLHGDVFQTTLIPVAWDDRMVHLHTPSWDTSSLCLLVSFETRTRLKALVTKIKVANLAMEAENAFGFLELLNVTLAAVWSTTHIANPASVASETKASELVPFVTSFGSRRT